MGLLGLFGLKTSKEVEEEKRLAAEEARKQNIEKMKGGHIQFGIPEFDVFDPRLAELGVPVIVHGSIMYEIIDLDRFENINGSYNEETFKTRLRNTIIKFVKDIITNAPIEDRIPLLQLERKIIELSTLVQNYVTPQVDKLLGVQIRSIDITSIEVNKNCQAYRELKAITSDLDKENILAKHNAAMSNFNLTNELQQDAMRRQQEMQLGKQEDLQSMQLENERETLRIKREEMQRASRLQLEQTFLGAHQANLDAAVLTQQFKAMEKANRTQFKVTSCDNIDNEIQACTPPQVEYMVAINENAEGPYNWEQLQRLVQQGLLTNHTLVWKEGMNDWAMAGTIAELTQLFQYCNK